MFQLCSKLKRVKTKLKGLNRKKFSCISKRVEVTREAFENIQSRFAKDLFESGLIED